MPFIEVKTTEDLSAVAAELKSALGDAITAIPGKSESWLMVNLVGEQKMYFQGSDAPCALFSVSIFGTATDDAYDDLTCRLCAIAQQYLQVPPERTGSECSKPSLQAFCGSDRKSTRLNSSHITRSRMPSSA